MPQNNIRFKMSLKITLAIFVITMAVSLITGTLCISNIKRSMLEDCKHQATGLAQAAAANIDAEAFSMLKPGDEDTLEFQSIRKMLQAFMSDDGAVFVYTMRKVDDRVEFVVDADPDDPAELGEEYESYDILERALSGEIVADDEETTDEWGSYYTGYAPILSDDEGVVGVVGVDYSSSNINSKRKTIIKKIVLIEIIMIVISCVLALLLGRIMGKNVLTIDQKMRELASNNGDLTQQIYLRSKDEIGSVATSFNAFMDKLRNMMTQIKDNEEKLQSATDSIAGDIDSANDELGRIVVTLGEMTQAMNDTNEAVTEITEAVYSTREIADGLFDKTSEGAEFVDTIKGRADQSMLICKESQARMREVVERISDNLSDTVEQSKNIARIARLTDDIISVSEQTQLLALNASIEAARAGENGKGFAVVADEISKLADETAKTAQEIVDSVDFIFETVNNLASAAEEMIAFVSDDINSDYDTMVGVGETYAFDANAFLKYMSEFAQMAETLKQNVESIEGNILQTAAVLQEEAASVASLSENSNQISENMQTVQNNSDINRTIARDLSGVLGEFKL